MDRILKRRLENVLFPTILIVWVTCTVVLICQYKGMVPWLGQAPEAVIVLVTAIPPLLLAMYIVSELFRIVFK